MLTGETDCLAGVCEAVRGQEGQQADGSGDR